MADVASSFKNWSASAASNNPTSATVIGSGLAPNLQQLQATLRTELGSRSGGITAASTVDLNTVDEGTVLVNHVSGTVAISSFGTVGAGIKKLVTFSVTAGTLTLSNNATSMILPSAADIAVSNGDSLIAESLGSGNWKVHVYSKADGKAIKAFDVKNAANDSTFASTSSTDATSPEWVIGKIGKTVVGVSQTRQAAEATNTGATFTDGTPKYRAAGSTYTVPAGKPINIFIRAQNNGVATFYVNGSAKITSAGTEFLTVSLMLLPGETYSFGTAWSVWDEVR